MVENPYLKVDKQIVSEIYTTSEPMDNLKVLCDVYGSRFPGTKGDLRSVKWMVKRLKKYGVRTPTTSPSRSPDGNGARRP